MEKEELLKYMGERIKSARIRCGYSQEFLAKKIGYASRSSIAKIESGERDITRDKVVLLAAALGVTPSYLMGWTDEESGQPQSQPTPGAVRIPVLGRVAAGLPISAQEDIIDWEEIPAVWEESGEYFALQIQGDSMTPRICSGDVVIVRKQNDVETNDLAIVLVNGDDATLKRVKKQENGITLIANNVAVYEPHFYTNEEVKRLPIVILGKV
ncbi:MAG: XRE family transcriptional regulator, partial [Negativicoccus succinicivorans]|nr:XRE family transcriptional regulator [Negativicoccus succinicivorans]